MNGSLDEFVDLMADTVIVKRKISQDFRGDSKTYGTPITVKAFVAGSIREVMDATGQTRTSTVTVVLGQYLDVTTEDEFTLPARFQPRIKPAISVMKMVDENGPHHETVFF